LNIGGFTMKKTVLSLLSVCTILSLIALSVIISHASSPSQQDIRERFARKFPGTRNIEEIRESPVKGMYEIVTHAGIIYYCPDGDYMIFGEIWDSTGKSLTAERRSEVTSKKMASLPLDKAVKIGAGKNRIVEFVDPECAYCRTAYDYFKNKDVTVYAFVIPLMGTRSENKVKYMACAKDKVKAYHEIFSGKDISLPVDCSVPPDSMNELRKFASKYGVTGVPFFLVNGQAVNGINTKRIDELLKNRP